MCGPKKNRQTLNEPHMPETLDADATHPGPVFHGVGSVSSATDFTGLIPAAPDSEAALAAYEELYPFDAEPGQ